MIVVSLLAILITVLGFVCYSKNALSGPLRPNPVSWLIWSLNGAVLCAGHFLAGGTFQSGGVPIVQCAGPAILAYIAWRQLSSRRLRLTEIENACLLLALSALTLCVLSRDAWIGIAAGLGVEAFAAIPTLMHLWHQPEEESLTSWVCFFIGAVLNICATPAGWGLATIVPWYFVLQGGTIALLLAYRGSVLQRIPMFTPLQVEAEAPATPQSRS